MAWGRGVLLPVAVFAQSLLLLWSADNSNRDAKAAITDAVRRQAADSGDALQQLADVGDVPAARPGRGQGVPPPDAPFKSHYDFVRPRRPIEGGATRAELQARTSWALDRFGGVYGCNGDDLGQRYAAAWLTTCETFLQNPAFASVDAAKKQLQEHPGMTLEEPTFAGMREHNVLRTVDLFDFNVHHLSTYYKRVGRRKEYLPSMYVNLAAADREYAAAAFHNPTGVKNAKVVVVVPFFWACCPRKPLDEMYTKITIKALAQVFPNVVVSVQNRDAFLWLVEESGLNRYLYDVIVMEEVTPKFHNAQLPMLTLVEAQRRLAEKVWGEDFEWIYYTENDQIPHLRDVDRLLAAAAAAPKTVVVPHRNFVYPQRGDFVPHNVSVADELMRTVSAPGSVKNGTKRVEEVPNTLEASCCFTQAIKCDKAELEVQALHGDSADVVLVKQRSTWAYAAGNIAGNEWALKTRPCAFTREGSACVLPGTG